MPEDRIEQIPQPPPDVAQLFYAMGRLWSPPTPAPEAEAEPEPPPDPDPEPETHDCDRCGSTFEPDQLGSVGEERQWCPACRCNYASECDECGELHPSDDIENVYIGNRNSRDYCPDCVPSSFVCEGCDRRIIDDYYGDDGHCVWCRQDDRSCLQSYDSDPPMEFYGEGPLFYGIELEVVSASSTSMNDSVSKVKGAIGRKGICKEDGSLPDNGFEICMSPMDLEYHRTFWPNVLSKNLKIRAWGHSSCGMHIHISKEPIPPVAVAKMLRFVGCPRNTVFLNTIFGRPSNGYCERVESKFDFECSGHHYALSTSPEHTLEMRGFKSSVNHRAIISAVEFCDALVAFSSPEFRGLKGAEGYEALVKFVLCRTERWPLLASLFKVGRSFISNRDMTVESALAAEGVYVLMATSRTLGSETSLPEDGS